MVDHPLTTLRAPVHKDTPRLDPVCVSCTAPEDDSLTFAVSEHWKLLLHPDQTVPGALLVVSLRHVPKVSELNANEAFELFELYKCLEQVLERGLGASMVNLSCLRNWAYRRENPDPPLLNGLPNPHVHWHVAPRYASPVSIEGVSFIHDAFGKELVWKSRRIGNDVRTRIIAVLSDGLGLPNTPE